MNSFYAIYLIAIMQNPIAEKGKMQKVEQYGFQTISECNIEKARYIQESKIETFVYNMTVAPWDSKEPNGAFCCIVATKGATCKTTSKLAVLNR